MFLRRDIMMFLLAAIFVVAAEGYPVDGLVLYLSFDKDTVQGDTVRDLSPEGNDGIIHGQAELGEGKYGEAMTFDGVDDYVEVPLTDSITFTTGSSFSAQAWIKTNDSPTKNDGIVGNYRESTQALWMISVSGDNEADRGRMRFSVRDVGKVHSAGVTSVDFLNDDVWHHLVGVRDQTVKKLRFYVDGVLIGEVDDQTEDINSGQSIWVGEHLSRYYKGSIDEVKIWNRPLTESEIKASMAGSTAVDPDGKIATVWARVK